MTPPAPGLYAITDTTLTRERGLVPCVEAALRGGAVMLQYRDKRPDRAVRLENGRALAALCQRFGVPLIINDDALLARECGASGVHLGRDDMPVAEARGLLGPAALIGVSCYHDLDRALQAEVEGASYVAFGRFFPSTTKPGQPLATPELLREAVARLALPVAAIGGITAGNGANLASAGARWLAVIHELWSRDDCEASARALGACFR